jgi:hypothetical protein
MLRIDNLDKRIANKLIRMVGKTHNKYKHLEHDKAALLAITKLLGYLNSVSFGIELPDADLLSVDESSALHSYYSDKCKPLSILCSQYATFTQLLERMLFFKD